MLIKILGIETSCDETSAAVVTGDKKILSNVVYSQIKEHSRFGGVVPEVASRSHLSFIEEVTQQAIENAKISLSEIDAVAVTAGPGLIGGVLVGVMYAKGLSFALMKPLIAVNHLEGHALTARMTNEVEFPYLLLLVSGGHCQILVVEGVGQYNKLGGTLDDAVGEAFDKVAKMLGLGYPGGPIVEKLARQGNEYKYKFPIALKGRGGCDFSFSGLKTSVRNLISKLELTEEVAADICASFQYTVSESLIERLKNSVEIAKKWKIKQLVIAGGVAANQYLLNKITATMEAYGIETIAPPIKLCTDNGAMIAWAGVERFRLQMVDDLMVVPRPRWPLY